MKILLLCDNAVRELDALRFLRLALVKHVKAEVVIAGSLAEWERIFYLLHAIQPNIVFLTQIQEQKCRELAAYIKASGAKVCVIPPETTLVAALKNVIVNPQLHYDSLIDYLFLPGESLHKLYRRVDIDQHKVHVTGSPKVDVLITAKGEGFYSRKKFTQRFKIPPHRKNIFVFSSFRNYSKEYIQKDIAFTGVTQIANEESDFIDKSLEEYLKVLPVLCERYPHHNIIVKPHPLEDRSIYKKIKYPNFHLIEQNCAIQACLKSIDLAIHWNSTVAAECWLHEIKTLQYSPCKEYAHLLSDLHKGNPLFTDGKSLIQGIHHYLSHNLEKKYIAFQDKYLKRNYGSLEPNSSEHIAQILAQELKKDTSPVHFKRNYSFRCFFFIILEKCLGVRIARWLVKLYIKEYQFNYGIENHVYET